MTLRLTYLTAGAAGMFCGSCLRDNTLVRALTRLGCDALLVPTYTPIRTDEEDVSQPTVYYGGINVFLQQKLWLFRKLPRWLDRWLDRPGLIRRLAEGRMETSARQLGELTVSMLQGESGRQRKEVRRLVDYLAGTARPQIVNLSNVLIGGCTAAIKRRLNVPVLVTLQGDDLFLADLPEPYQSQTIDLISRLDEHIDGYLTFSRYYADFMSGRLRLPREKIHLVPLGIDVEGFPRPDAATDRDAPSGPPTIGFLARHCPAKGLQALVDAFLSLRRELGAGKVRLHTAGWLGAADRPFFDAQVAKLREAGAGDDFHYAGVVDRRQKIEFLRSIDVLCVPTTYRDPKGLYVLEALAAGVPVVVPDHGAFPELLSATGGGRLVVANDPARLVETLREVLSNRAESRRLGQAGQRRVHADFTATAMATATLDVYRRFVGQK